MAGVNLLPPPPTPGKVKRFEFLIPSREEDIFTHRRCGWAGGGVWRRAASLRNAAARGSTGASLAREHQAWDRAPPASPPLPGCPLGFTMKSVDSGRSDSSHCLWWGPSRRLRRVHQTPPVLASAPRQQGATDTWGRGHTSCGHLFRALTSTGRFYH